MEVRLPLPEAEPPVISGEQQPKPEKENVPLEDLKTIQQSLEKLNKSVGNLTTSLEDFSVKNVGPPPPPDIPPPPPPPLPPP